MRIISIVYSPIIPKGMKKLRKMINLSGDTFWKDLDKKQIKFEIGEVYQLFRKIEDKEIEKQLELLKATQKGGEKMIEHKPEVEYEVFTKLEFRVVKILEAEKIEKSNKLIKLKISINGEERTAVAGISQSYEPEELVGKKVAMLLNLKPRKVMGVESQAMILSADDEGKYAVLVPDKEVKEGSEIL